MYIDFLPETGVIVNMKTVKCDGNLNVKGKKKVILVVTKKVN